MAFDTKGNGKIIIIFVIVVLAFIAYGIAKKNTVMAPTIEDTPGDMTNSGSGTTTSGNGGGSDGAQDPGGVSAPGIEVNENEKLTELEGEAEDMTQDFDDLMFEDLGFE